MLNKNNATYKYAITFFLLLFEFLCKYSIMLEYPWKLANTKKCSTMTKVACVDAYLQSNALVE